MVAELETVAGQKIESSVAHLLPLRVDIRPTQRWKAVRREPGGLDTEQMWESDEEVTAEPEVMEQ